MAKWKQQEWQHNAVLSTDTLDLVCRRQIPTGLLHLMDIPYLEERSENARGSYAQDPDKVYLDFQKRAGCCMIDQYLAHNPLSMGNEGYSGETERGASTGAADTILDGIAIDSPEAVIEHLERYVFPGLAHASTGKMDASGTIENLVREEREMQAKLGPSILKVPYGEGFQHFPCLRYTTYGYVNYFEAFLMYPEVMEKDFRLQADVAVARNRVVARAYEEGKLPKMLRLDHDMADGRGTLVDIRMLDTLWFPHFARSIQPYLDAGVRLVWHCDGNLMEMVPRLLESGISGFQGFQYEYGMDYPQICRMRTREGEPLIIEAGVSVTTTLPFGTVEQVREEVRWLVEQGPEVGLFLALSSSACPGIPWENLDAALEGMAYYREHGRD